VVGNWLARWYNRRPRDPVIAVVRGLSMQLDPSENVDGQLLFQPQLYDRRELDALAGHLRPGDTFVDVGAHIGLYSLFAASRVGPSGRVVAVEADPVNASRLRANVARNAGLSALVEVVEAGVSDRDEVLRLGLNTAGNRSGNSFLNDGPDAVEVRCRPLAEILRAAGVDRVDAMKMDIEGFEYRVLEPFFEHAPAPLWPRMLILEYQPAWDARAGGSSLGLALARGYRERVRAGINRVLVRESGA
jgi:FkbM family methyltransferase